MTHSQSDTSADFHAPVPGYLALAIPGSYPLDDCIMDSAAPVNVPASGPRGQDSDERYALRSMDSNKKIASSVGASDLLGEGASINAKRNAAAARGNKHSQLPGPAGGISKKVKNPRKVKVNAMETKEAGPSRLVSPPKPAIKDVKASRKRAREFEDDDVNSVQEAKKIRTVERDAEALKLQSAEIKASINNDEFLGRLGEAEGDIKHIKQSIPSVKELKERIMKLEAQRERERKEWDQEKKLLERKVEQRDEDAKEAEMLREEAKTKRKEIEEELKEERILRRRLEDQTADLRKAADKASQEARAAKSERVKVKTSLGRERRLRERLEREVARLRSDADDLQKDNVHTRDKLNKVQIEALNRLDRMREHHVGESEKFCEAIGNATQENVALQTQLERIENEKDLFERKLTKRRLEVEDLNDFYFRIIDSNEHISGRFDAVHAEDEARKQLRTIGQLKTELVAAGTREKIQRSRIDELKKALYLAASDATKEMESNEKIELLQSKLEEARTETSKNIVDMPFETLENDDHGTSQKVTAKTRGAGLCGRWSSPRSAAAGHMTRQSGIRKRISHEKDRAARKGKLAESKAEKIFDAACDPCKERIRDMFDGDTTMSKPVPEYSGNPMITLPPSPPTSTSSSSPPTSPPASSGPSQPYAYPADDGFIDEVL